MDYTLRRRNSHLMCDTTLMIDRRRTIGSFLGPPAAMAMAMDIRERGALKKNQAPWWQLNRPAVAWCVSFRANMMQTRARDSLVLCFDGTGNKFKGNAGDTNILKIFRMLDRRGDDQCKCWKCQI